MNEALFLAIAGVFALVLMLMAFALVRISREQKKLRKALDDLKAEFNRGSADVAGLCSAAVTVDKRLSVNESRLSAVLDNLNTLQKAPPKAQHVMAEEDDEQPQSYQTAIEKIRRGADLDELVKSCGLTRDEAVLLMRLHANR